MGKKIKGEVIIDTYALLAMVYDEVGMEARRVLEEVYKGNVKGLIPVIVMYEYIIHWSRGRIPALKSLDEVTTYLKSYFKIINLDYEDYIEAAMIKIRGDKLLKEAEDPNLKNRRLSIVDSTIIALAHRRKTPIITGDKDLTYIATKQGIKTIW